MAPPHAPSDPRRPAEARAHPQTLGRAALAQDGGDLPDLRGMLATLLAVAAILTKAKAAAWIALLVLLSSLSNLRGLESAAPLISALPPIVFAFLSCYRPPPALQGANTPLDALAALFWRRKG